VFHEIKANVAIKTENLEKDTRSSNALSQSEAFSGDAEIGQVFVKVNEKS